MNIMNSLAQITPGYRSAVKWRMKLATIVYSLLFLVLFYFFLLKASILVVYFVLVFYAYDRFIHKYRERVKKLNLAIQCQTQFEFSKKHISPKGDWAIALDSKQKTLLILFLKSKYSYVQSTLVPCSDILEVEILENSYSIVKTSEECDEECREETLGSDQEAIEEEKSEKQEKRSQKVESLELKLVINHLKNQVCTIPFSNKKLKRDSKKYLVIKESIFQWYDLVKGSVNHV